MTYAIHKLNINVNSLFFLNCYFIITIPLDYYSDNKKVIAFNYKTNNEFLFALNLTIR
jgi:hypothetical protein